MWEVFYLEFNINILVSIKRSIHFFLFNIASLLLLLKISNRLHYFFMLEFFKNNSSYFQDTLAC